ncbi:MAG: hypothetical protein AAF629_04785 [Chloroflexota bacterium]
MPNWLRPLGNRYKFIIIVVIFACSVFGGWPLLNRWLYPVSYLTVDEIWDNPEPLQGKRIIVRGWGLLQVTNPGTQNECYPNLCQCVLNETKFYLTANSSVEKIQIQGVECMGDACPRMCIGRETIAPQAYELVGTLQVRRGAKKSLCYWTVAGLKANANTVSRRVSDIFSQSICRSKNTLIQQAWHPLNDYYARHFYSLELTDVRLVESKRLVGLGGLTSLRAEPLSKAEFVVIK